MASELPTGRQRLTFRHWLILILAAIGFGFDIYVLLIMQYIGKGLLAELLPHADPATRLTWRGLLFWVPMLAGGSVGLVGGYLTDLLGRRRILSYSILLYAVATFASGFATTLPMFLVLRCLTLIGVCVEFVAAIAWLAELFPQHEQRERVLGYTQAFSSFGGMTVAAIFLLFDRYNLQLPALQLPEFLEHVLGPVADPHASWRYTLLSGVLPAIPLILIRPFMPESPVWAQKKAAGTLRRPSFTELLSPELFRTTVVTTLMFACSYGIAFGGIQQVQFMVEAMPTYQAEAAQVSAGKPAAAAKGASAKVLHEMTGRFGFVQEVGGLIGRFLLAALAVYVVSRRGLLRIFLVPCLLIAPLVFGYGALHNRELFTLNFGGGPVQVTWFHVGIFLVGLLTTSQFSFWGNYLPTVYPVHLRGTCESVAANLGGRILGTSFALVTSEVAGLFAASGGKPSLAEATAYAAAVVVGSVLLVGFVLSFFLPEPAPEKVGV
ncbi:MAG TPA: MFS transporter [Gemmataceae bacterium]|nr:MFS transporter [Gemmataceae bacterium]